MVSCSTVAAPAAASGCHGQSSDVPGNVTNSKSHFLRSCEGLVDKSKLILPSKLINDFSIFNLVVDNKSLTKDFSSRQHRAARVPGLLAGKGPPATQQGSSTGPFTRVVS